MKQPYPFLHRVTAFIADEFPALAHRDASLSSTMEAFALGLVLGRVGTDEGYRHMQAIEALMRMAPKDKTGRTLLLEYLTTHGFYALPTGRPRRKATSEDEKRRRLKEAGWRCNSRSVSRHVATPGRGNAREVDVVERWKAPDDLSSAQGVTLQSAWRTFMAATEQRR
jgi:hypothetical protein